MKPKSWLSFILILPFLLSDTDGTNGWQLFPNLVNNYRDPGEAWIERSGHFEWLFVRFNWSFYFWKKKGAAQ